MNKYKIQVKQHFALFALAGILQCVLLGALFLRSTPFMRPYVTNIWHYFPHVLPELKKFSDAYFDFSDYTIENYNKIYPETKVWSQHNNQR